MRNRKGTGCCAGSSRMPMSANLSLVRGVGVRRRCRDVAPNKRVFRTFVKRSCSSPSSLVDLAGGVTGGSSVKF